MKRYSLLLLALVAIGCSTAPPKGIQPVADFEVDRYLGRWYEIARLDHRFERGLTDVTADYSLNDDGTIAVLNRGYNPQTGEWETAEGKAKFRGAESIGSLKVSFFGPFYGGYHVFELGDEYDYAMVAGPSKNFLWLLARSPEMDDALFERLVSRADELAFDTDELIRVDHTRAAK